MAIRQRGSLVENENIFQSFFEDKRSTVQGIDSVRTEGWSVLRVLSVHWVFQDLFELLLSELSVHHLAHLSLAEVLVQGVDEAQERGQRTE